MAAIHSSVRNEWEIWLSEGEQRPALYTEANGCWQQISDETTRSGFKKPGLLTISEANSEPAVDGSFILANNVSAVTDDDEDKRDL